MKALFILLPIVLFLSCESRKKGVSIDTAGFIPDSTELFIKDSLEKYAGTDGLYFFDTSRCYIGTTNNKGYAFYEMNDSTTILYQKTVLDWVATDSFPYFLFAPVQVKDLNGDSYPDLVFIYNITGAGGNVQNHCMLYRPSSGLFEHDKHFDLPNILYDPKKNLVFSSWWGSANHPQEKMSYKIAGDSLVFEEGVTYLPDETSQGERGTVEFYRMKNEERIVLKKVSGNSDRTFAVFEKALWYSGE